MSRTLKKANIDTPLREIMRRNRKEAKEQLLPAPHKEERTTAFRSTQRRRAAGLCLGGELDNGVVLQKRESSVRREGGEQ